MRDYFKDRDNRIVWIISLVTIIAACAPLFTKLCMNGHDLEYHLLRIESLKEGIQAGRPFLKINMLFFGGAGYASSLFYPDFLLYIPAVLRVFGVTINTSYHIFVGVCIILCYLSAYYCAKGMTGSRFAGIVTAILLTLCHYHIEDIYVRSAVGEYTAFIFLPFIIYGIYNVLFYEMDKPYLLSIGFGGLLLCHTGSFVLCVGLCAVIFLIRLKVLIRAPRVFLRLAITALVTAGVTCFYWLPLLEQLMSTEFLVSTPWMDPVNEARTFAQLFYTQFPSIGAGLIIIYIVRILVKKESFDSEDREKNNDLIGFADLLYLFGILAALASTKLFPWEKLGKYLGFIQFPWRLFIIASALFVFADGIVIYDYIERGKNFLPEMAAAGVFVVCALSAFFVMEQNDQGYYDYSDDYYVTWAVPDNIQVYPVYGSCHRGRVAARYGRGFGCADRTESTCDGGYGRGSKL